MLWGYTVELPCVFYPFTDRVIKDETVWLHA